MCGAGLHREWQPSTAISCTTADLERGILLGAACLVLLPVFLLTATWLTARETWGALFDPIESVKQKGARA